MNEEILINVTPQETRIAVVENGMVQEIHVERTRSRGLVGNIYLGTVERVLPGMQAAFVNIGIERTAFIHARDLSPQKNRLAEYQQHDPNTSISSMLTEGQSILVQVVKDPIGTKGARLTKLISIPARNTVLLPKEDYVGISQRIKGVERRADLLQQLNTQIQATGINGGVILRTAGESATADEIADEIRILDKVWRRISEKACSASAPELIHRDLPLATRMVRDLDWEDVERVRIDSREMHHSIKCFVGDLVPGVADRIELYQGSRPIFELYGTEDEISRALKRKVPLKSGGYLVIDQTEAMTTIDVNTGSYTGGRNLEETVFKTNLEAVTALSRQLRLRNIGGIIIVDFIDMSLEKHSDQVMSTLRRALDHDDSRTTVNEMSSLGLVEITRKRTRDSLNHLLTETCQTCEGRGYLKTPQTVCYEIFRELLSTAREFAASRYLVIASPAVIDQLLEEESTGVADLGDFIGGEITLQVDSQFHQEKFDVVLM